LRVLYSPGDFLEEALILALRRGVGLVLIIIGIATLVSFAGLLFLYAALSREPTVPRDSTLVLRIGGELMETVPDDVVTQLLRRARPPTVREIVESLRKAKVDRRISSVLVVPGGIQSPFWAKPQEIRDAILDYRRSGKPAIALLEHAGDREYYIASACDRVYLLPTTSLDLNGLASYEVFLRGTLDKIGVYPDLLHVGEYKTAVNTFTERSFTPPHREMAESLNLDMYEQLVRDIARSRKKNEAEVVALLDRGPFLPEEAVEAGLVDELAYEDQVEGRLKREGRRLRRIEGAQYSRVSARSLGLTAGRALPSSMLSAPSSPGAAASIPSRASCRFGDAHRVHPAGA
jgi:protease IV